MKVCPALQGPCTSADGAACGSCRTNQSRQEGPRRTFTGAPQWIRGAGGAAAQVVENRLFSEGLHVLGRPPTEAHLAQYLSAFFDKGLGPHAVDAVVQARGGGLEAVRRV